MASTHFLKITKQESLAQDKFAKNGNVKTIFWVAKNNPFTIHVSASFNLNQYPVLARVMYDDDKGMKEVETVKSTPLEYIAHIDDSGLNAACELRLKVLSSQQEGAFFRVAFSSIDPTGKLLEVLSQPIKVVSKKLQIRRLLAKQETATAETPLPPPKRTSADIVTEALNRLEHRQSEQTKLLQQLLTNQSQFQLGQPFKFVQPPQDEEDGEFETSFKKFIGSLQKIPVEDRPNKLRKTIETLAPPQTQVLGDFINTVLSDTTSHMTEVSSSPYSSSPLIHAEQTSSDLENGFDNVYFDNLLAQ
jgi:hypothetical protein